MRLQVVYMKTKILKYWFHNDLFLIDIYQSIKEVFLEFNYKIYLVFLNKQSNILKIKIKHI